MKNERDVKLLPVSPPRRSASQGSPSLAYFLHEAVLEPVAGGWHGKIVAGWQAWIYQKVKRGWKESHIPCWKEKGVKKKSRYWRILYPHSEIYALCPPKPPTLESNTFPPLGKLIIVSLPTVSIQHE